MIRVAATLLAFAAIAAGCQTVEPPYRLVSAGSVTVGGLTVTAGDGWNENARTKANFNGPGAVWTRDGMRLDYLIVIPAVADGSGIFKEPNAKVVYPKFHATMLPNEIVTLIEASLTRHVFGEGRSVVASSNLRPAPYGADKGFAFDVSVTVSDGPDRQGVVGGFVADGKLNLVMFLAAVPYYWDKDRERAETVIASARRSSAG